MDVFAYRTKKPIQLFLVLLIGCFLMASCASGRYGQRRPGKRKKNCGDCPSWSYVKPHEKGDVYIYGRV
jgi:hypothetical protein